MISKQEAINFLNKRFENLESKIDSNLKKNYPSYSFDSEQEMEFFKRELKPKYESGGWEVKIVYYQSNSNDQRDTDY